MSILIYDLPAHVGKRVSFICNRGVQVTGILVGLYPERGEADNDNPGNMPTYGLGVYNFDFAEMRDVQILGAGGVVLSAHPDGFTYPLRPITDVVTVDDGKGEPKQLPPAVEKLYEVADQGCEEIRPVARYLEAENAKVPGAPEDEDASWTGWNAGMSHLREILSEAEGDLDTVREWVKLVPDHKALQGAVDAGASMVVHGYQHLFEHMIDSGVTGEVRTAMDKLNRLLTSWVNEARLKSPL